MTDRPNDVKRLPVVGVRPEVLTALDALSAATGLSRAFLVRSILTTALEELGLLTEADSTPTHQNKRKDK